MLLFSVQHLLDSSDGMDQNSKTELQTSISGTRSSSVQRSEVSKPKNVSSLALVILKYINSDKTLQKMPILWNFWLKNAYYRNTVNMTLFHGMLLQKRKQFLDIFSFQYGAISITKKKTISVIFGKNQKKILQKLLICYEIWHFLKK